MGELFRKSLVLNTIIKGLRVMKEFKVCSASSNLFSELPLKMLAPYVHLINAMIIVIDYLYEANKKPI